MSSQLPLRPQIQSSGVDSTTRRLRAFVALAEHRHFGNAARTIFVSQQALSKQIATLEAEVGVLLVRRSPRSVELTSAGELFLAACRDALSSLDAAVDFMRGRSGYLRVGLVVLGAVELTDLILDAFRARRPGCELVLRQFPFRDPSAGLADRTSDLAVVRLPITVPGLRLHRLFAEPRVAAVAASHPLAQRADVKVRMLLRERLTVSTAPDDAYRRFWALMDHRSVRPRPPIPVRSHAEELEVVASAQAISITSACAARLTPHSGVRFVSITDIPKTECALAWRTEDETPEVCEFIHAASRVLDRERPLLAAIEDPQL